MKTGLGQTRQKWLGDCAGQVIDPFDDHRDRNKTAPDGRGLHRGDVQDGPRPGLGPAEHLDPLAVDDAMG